MHRCGVLSQGRNLLCIQDTSEFNLSNQQGRLKKDSGLGKTTKEGILGFTLHSSLVVDADKGSALGYSFIKLWERKADAPDRYERKYKTLPIEQKESNKWLEATVQSKKLLKVANSITIVCDREADIYDLLESVSGEHIHFLIRSSSNRQLTGNIKLQDYLTQLPIMHQYDLAIRGDVRKNIEKRTAPMALKWGKVSVLKPSNSKNKSLAPSKELYVVEAREQTKSGIYWRLITTHAVTNEQEAMPVIEWYKHRWYIEQVHRLLKTEGFRIERSQLEQGWAIRKLTLLAMMATLRILQMMLAYEDDNEQPIDEVFDKQQQQCLQMMNHQLEGNTDKQKNASKPSTLKWATWIIARLGGWKGYASQRKPGPIVFQKGLIKFYHMFEGWMMYQKFARDVSTP